MNKNKVLAEELRIGNYHKSEGLDIPRMGIGSVRIGGQSFAAITGFGIYLVESGQLEFEPIPLTTEWLERLGFSLLKHDLDFYTKSFYQPGRNAMSIRVFFNRGWHCSITEFDSAVTIPMEYIHQLQNLYFALTGQELTVKL